MPEGYSVGSLKLVVGDVICAEQINVAFNSTISVDMFLSNTLFKDRLLKICFIIQYNAKLIKLICV